MLEIWLRFINLIPKTNRAGSLVFSNELNKTLGATPARFVFLPRHWHESERTYPVIRGEQARPQTDGEGEGEIGTLFAL